MKSFLVLTCLVVAAQTKPPPSEYDAKRPPPSKYEVKRPPPSDEDLSGILPQHEEGTTLPPIMPRATLTCGTHVLDEGTYTIESINHPSNYINYHDCDYSITASGASQIAFECSAFNVELESSCGWDWVTFNGQKYCGTSAPPAGSYGSITFEFHTDYSVVRPGFSCSLTVSGGGGGGGSGSQDLGCGSHALDEGEYTIKSPGHPENYGNDKDCSYSMTANNAEHKLSISCPAFNIEQNSQCSWDWLRVNGVKSCGTSGPTTSSVGSMAIDFHSDYSVVKSGYICTITVAADGGEGGGGGGGGGGGTGERCCGIPNRANRIVGGVQTEVNEYPWQVGLVSVGGTRTWCGGTLINNRYVLTAAHCTVNTQPSSIEVLIREHRISQSDGEIRASVANILNHPSYTSASGSGYDFSLLKLSEPVDFTDDNRVAPACLPSVASNMYVGSDAVVTGWGSTSSGGSQATTLQEVTVPVVSNDVCSNSYSSINPTMICAGLSAGGKDSCQGDSGGPMVTLEGDRYSLIGVVSWGRGCALPGYPGVYARVTSVIDWIQSNTSDGTYCN